MTVTWWNSKTFFPPPKTHSSKNMKVHTEISSHLGPKKKLRWDLLLLFLSVFSVFSRKTKTFYDSILIFYPQVFILMILITKKIVFGVGDREENRERIIPIAYVMSQCSLQTSTARERGKMWRTKQNKKKKEN